MAIDPAKVALYIPPGLKSFKQDLFERIAASVTKHGGQVIRADVKALAALPAEVTPLVGCMPECTPLIAQWRQAGRRWAYWDRGYARRVFATWLPRAASIDVSYYRAHLGSFQLQRLMPGAKPDRWEALKIPVAPWKKGGRHIVIAAPTRTYSRFHRTESWIADTIDALARVTDRQLVIRDKESKRPLQADLDGAHCLVTHGSIAAVESVILGCPVVVDRDSAAALVGRTQISDVEKPNYADREPWLWSLAHSQWNERELANGTLWREIV